MEPNTVTPKRSKLSPRWMAALIVLVILIAAAAALVWRAARPRASAAPDYWPTAGWRTSTPEEQGMYSGKLAEALLATRQKDVQIHSLLIIRNGHAVLDANFYPYDGQDPHNMASVTKSLMTTLIGIAVDQGKLSLDDKMVSFFPDRAIKNLDERKESITVGHLASMSSGLDCTNEQDELTLQQMVSSPDWVQFALDRKAAWEPGEQFVYCSPAIHLLSPILQQATGMSTLDFARRYLFEPLGIGEVMWPQDPQGYYDGWSDVSMDPHDMAKLGLLFLNKGQWDGKQIVSRQWVEDATSAHMQTFDDPYGFGWWIESEVAGYRAAGRGGQYIYVLPEWNMVMVATGGGYEMDEIAPGLVASFSDFTKPLPADPEGVAKLQAAVQAVAAPPPVQAVTELPEMARRVSGQTYVLEPNPSGLQTVRFDFDNSAQATFSFADDDQAISSPKVGLDGVYRFSPAADGRPFGFRGRWVNPQAFLLEYDGITNNDHSLLAFQFEGDEVKVSIQETAHGQGPQFVGHLQEP